MSGKPKPTKAARKDKRQQEKFALIVDRSNNVKLAINRDDGFCVFCWFLHKKKTKHTDVHHVYGRGHQAGDWRENYTKLICVCREHHPQPIKKPFADDNMAYVEAVMGLANTEPINKKFTPPDL